VLSLAALACIFPLGMRTPASYYKRRHRLLGQSPQLTEHGGTHAQGSRHIGEPLHMRATLCPRRTSSAPSSCKRVSSWLLRSCGAFFCVRSGRSTRLHYAACFRDALRHAPPSRNACFPSLCVAILAFSYSASFQGLLPPDNTHAREATIARVLRHRSNPFGATVAPRDAQGFQKSRSPVRSNQLDSTNW